MSKSGTGVLIGGLALVPVMVVALPLIALVALMGGSQNNTCTEQGVGGPGTGSLSVGGIPAEFVPLIQAAGKLSPAFPAPVLAAQIKQEGNFQKHGANAANASGYTQFIPETWAAYRKDTTGKGYADPNNASDAVDAQARYDRDLANQVIEAQRAGRLPAGASVTELALAGYNAGIGAVMSNGGIPPYAETQAYVPRIMAMARGEFSQAGTVDAAAATPAVDAGPADVSVPVGCGGSPVQVRVLALTYPASTGAQLPADVYRPPGGGAGTTPLRPMLVMVHGGGWFFGDRHEFDTVARDAAMHGYIAVNIEYDMTPPRWPKEPDDVKAAIAWARSQAAQWGGDPAKMATWGTSAGANLAVDAAAAGDHSGLQAAVGWSGPYDLAALPAQVDALAADCQRVASIADPAIYLGCLAITCPATYTAVSPALAATPGMPPVYLANSQTELVPLAQQEEMAATLHRLGVPHEAVVVPGSGHAIAYAGEQTTPTLAWLDKTLNFAPPSPPTVGGGSGGGGPAQQKVVESARAQLGLPYIWGGGGYNGPTGGGFDCSGLTSYAFHQAGLDLPRTAETQYAATANTMLPGGFNPPSYQPGDLLFYGTPGNIHHVAIAIGDGQLIQASTFGEPLNIKPIYNGDFFAATRPLK